MPSLSQPVRIAAVDFIQLHAPFLPPLAAALAPDATLAVCQPRAECRALRGQPGLTLSVLEALRPVDPKMSDAEVLEACGAHERMWAPSPAALVAHARLQLGRLQRFIDDTRPDLLLLWNGAPLLAALAGWLARRDAIATLYLENGYLPGTMQVDPAGTNYHSAHTGRLAAGAWRDAPVDDAALDAALERLRSGRARPDMQPARKPRPPLPRRILRELARLASPGGWRFAATLTDGRVAHRLPDDDPFVLLPMQMRKDSQLSLHSPLVGHDLERLIDVTAEAVARVLPTHRLVVKLHPKESAHRSRALLRRAAAHANVQLLRDVPMRQLLPRAALLVTVNSTVGVEAMAFDLPIVTLGRSFYAWPGLVTPCTALDALPAALAEALARPPDRAARRRFLGYLQSRMLVDGHFSDLSPRSMAAIATAIRAHAGLGVRG